MDKLIKIKKESDFIEDLNDIKNFIFILKDNYKDNCDFLDDLDDLLFKVDSLLKYL